MLGKSTSRFDVVLFVCVLLLVAIGLVFVYSASSYTAEKETGNKYFYLIKQGVGAMCGVVAMIVCANVSLEFVKKLYIVLPIIAIVLLILVFVPGVGVENYGATRWIGFGSFTLQPSEIAKFAFVLFASVYMSKSDVNMQKLKYSVPIFLIGGIFCVLIILEPNMSITMCMAFLLMTMLFLGGVKLKPFIFAIIPLVAGAVALILLEPYRYQRLMAFLDPWQSPKDEGYQLIQSLYALGSGGLFGVGLFNSRQKYRFLPFAESDFILSVIGEETGIFGCFLVFGLFFVIVWRGISIALMAKDKCSFFLASGIIAVIAIQTLVNFAVVTGSIPPTGLPLPFLSYGGTSLVVFMSAIGILLNISKTIQRDYPQIKLKGAISE